MYMRNPENNSPDSNHYAFPLDFMAVVDLVAMKVERIVRLPLGSDHSTTQVGSAVPAQKTNPVEPEYDPKLTKVPARTTMKPYNVIQPEGPSFSVKGHLIKWEKHRFRVGFNWREGMLQSNP
jgi:primary-amine oxidase